MTGFGFDPFGTSPFGGAEAPEPLPPLPTGRPVLRSPGVLVHVGEFLSGRILATIPVVSLRWSDVLNEAGSIECTVTADVVRDYGLRELTHGVRCFLAVERDGRIKQAGPIWSRTWNWEKSALSLGASGFWSWLDRLVVRPEAPPGTPYATASFTVSGKSLGGIARRLVEHAVELGPYTDAPLVLPSDEAGSHTETFPGWAVQWVGDELRQLTQRDTDAPDIRFTARRRADDPRFIEWVMQVGTEAKPSLSQPGPDWVFDTSAPKSSVLGITTDEDATGMGQLVYMTGNGMEEDLLFAFAQDSTLSLAGWPLTEIERSRSTVEDIATLTGHAENEVAKAARPIEVFKASVRAETAGEVMPGDYTRLITRDDVWLGDMDRSMRVRSVSGGLDDTVQLDMFPLQALL